MQASQALIPARKKQLGKRVKSNGMVREKRCI